MNDVALLLYGALALLWIIWALSISSRLASIRDEARKQTGLLEEIARNTRPSSEKLPAASGADYKIPGLNA